MGEHGFVGGVAMDNRGTLTLTVGAMAFGQSETIADGVTITITDDGPGIPEDIQGRIFEAFFTTKPAGEGSGLGLNVVKKIIEKHQGQIAVTSRPGCTSFTVTLPMQPPKIEEPSTIATTSTDN